MKKEEFFSNLIVKRDVKALIPLIHNIDPDNQLLALDAFSKIREPSTIPILVDAIKDFDNGTHPNYTDDEYKRHKKIEDIALKAFRKRKATPEECKIEIQIWNQKIKARSRNLAIDALAKFNSGDLHQYASIITPALQSWVRRSTQLKEVYPRYAQVSHDSKIGLICTVGPSLEEILISLSKFGQLAIPALWEFLNLLNIYYGINGFKTPKNILRPESLQGFPFVSALDIDLREEQLRLEILTTPSSYKRKPPNELNGIYNSEKWYLQRVCAELLSELGVTAADAPDTYDPVQLRHTKLEIDPLLEVSLTGSELEFLQELKKQLNTSIYVEVSIQQASTGFSVQDNHVTGLGLYNKGLTSLPVSIENLKSLQILNLPKNRLTTLPESVGNLSALKRLSLMDNQLNSLPASLGNLSRLEFLDLARNRLTSLPDSLGNLKGLKYLELQGNQLTSLPESFCNLISLVDLNIEENLLKDLPVSLITLPKLQYLFIAGNPSSLIHSQTLEALEKRGCTIRDGIPKTTEWA